MDESVLQLLDEHDWSKTIYALSAYVISLCRWKKITLPSGVEESDIAMQAIEKVYTGERNWNPGQEPDLLRYLKGVARSLVSNELRLAGATVLSLDDESVVEPAVSFDLDAELYFWQVNKEIAVQMRGDPVCAIIYKGFKDGMTLQAISHEYMIDIGDIRNARRRLHRIAIKVIDQLSKGI